MAVGQSSDQPGGSVTNADRRTTGFALRYWDERKRGRRCPATADLDPGESPRLRDHAFVVAVATESHGFTVTYSGPSLARLCGADPTGQPIDRCLPAPLRERTVQFLETATSLKRPMADSSRYTDNAGNVVAYRTVLMPLAGERGAVDHLFGVLTYKTEA